MLSGTDEAVAGGVERRPSVGWVLASLALCMLLPSLGTSIANVALPTLAEAFAASFQQAIIDCLIGKSMQAIKKFGVKRLCVGGGVAANREFRSQLRLACDRMNIELHIAAPDLCTDNAVMGALAWEKIKLEQFDTLELDAKPGLLRRC